MSHPIENIMRSSMEEIKAIADVNTVIGDPIITEDDTMILPVSKVALGLLVGGGEYRMQTGKRRDESEYEEGKPFAGVSTLGMSLTPLAFLAVSNGSVRLLPAKQENAADRIVEMIPHIMETAERLIKELSGGSCGEKGKRSLSHNCRGRNGRQEGSGTYIKPFECSPCAGAEHGENDEENMD